MHGIFQGAAHTADTNDIDAHDDLGESTPWTPEADLVIAPLAFQGTDAILALAGEMRRDTAFLLEQATARSLATIREQQRHSPSRFLFDLSGVSYLDARGLQTLAACAHSVREEQPAVAFQGARGQVLRLLTVHSFNLLYPLLG